MPPCLQCSAGEVLLGVGDLVLVKELLRPAKLADFYFACFLNFSRLI